MSLNAQVTTFTTGSYSKSDNQGIRQAFSQCWPGMTTATADAPAVLVLDQESNTTVEGYIDNTSASTASDFNLWYKLRVNGHPVSSNWFRININKTLSTDGYYWPSTDIIKLVKTSFGFLFMWVGGSRLADTCFYGSFDSTHQVAVGYQMGRDNSNTDSSAGGVWNNASGVWKSWNPVIPKIKSADATSISLLLGNLYVIDGSTFAPIRLCCIRDTNTTFGSYSDTDVMIGKFGDVNFYIYDYSIAHV